MENIDQRYHQFSHSFFPAGNSSLSGWLYCGGRGTWEKMGRYLVLNPEPNGVSKRKQKDKTMSFSGFWIERSGENTVVPKVQKGTIFSSWHIKLFRDYLLRIRSLAIFVLSTLISQFDWFPPKRIGIYLGDALGPSLNRLFPQNRQPPSWICADSNVAGHF